MGEADQTTGPGHSGRGAAQVRSRLHRRGVFVLRKARLAADLFRMGWSLRLPFVSADLQRDLRRRLLALRAARSVQALRILRSEVKGRIGKARGLVDLDARPKLMRAIEAGSLVSFDFYDTIVTRRSAVPEDALAYVGHLLRTEGLDPDGDFARVRLTADRVARAETSRPDVTLAEIYAAFPAAWDEVRRARAMALELRVEAACLVPRDGVVELARRIRERGGRAVIVSDTCMSGDFLRGVLDQLGLAGLFDEVYSSSDLMLRKDDGSVWPWLCGEVASGTAIVHVGDSRHSDVEQPRKAGIEAVGIPNAALAAEMRGYPLPRHWRSQNHDWRAGLALGPAIAAMGSDPFLGEVTGRHQFESSRAFGYAVIGPLVFGFISWLLREARRDGVDRLFFLSRDGYFLQRIYEACVVGSAAAVPEARYLYVSRRSALPAHLVATSDPVLLLKSKFAGTLAELFRGRLGVDVAGFAEATEAASPIRLPGDRNRLVAFATAHREAIRAQLQPGHDAFVDYLDRAGLRGAPKAALVDFSSSGTIQLALQGVLGRGLVAYNMMISRAFVADDGLGGRATACFVDAGDQWQLQPVQAAAILLEGLLTAPYGQITGYRREGDDVVPVFAPEPDSGAAFAEIAEAMGGAEDYCRELVAAYGPEVMSVDVSAADVQLPLAAFIRGRLRMPAALRRAITIEDAFGGNATMSFQGEG